MMVIADSGFWVALFNSKDRWHERARQWLAGYGGQLICTWPVLTEASHLIGSYLGPEISRRFVGAVQQGACEIFPLAHSALPRMTALMRQYQDLPMDLADASLVVVAECLGHGRIVSTDERDFQAYRWKRHYPFNNLLAPLTRPF